MKTKTEIYDKIIFILLNMKSDIAINNINITEEELRLIDKKLGYVEALEWVLED